MTVEENSLVGVEPIRRVGVIGAGVMGSGIAAHLSNAGVPSLLLDIVPKEDKVPKENKGSRSALAEAGVKAALKSRPPQFFHQSNASLIATGNLEDDIERLAECDLVIEAIIERLDIKQSLFAKLEAVLPENTIVSSNTSGLSIEGMLEGRKASFRKRFLVTHFFNPVRYMKLLEVVPGPDTEPQVIARVEALGRETLGKGIVHAFDTPDFVANRIGIHNMMLTLGQMVSDGLSIEDVDAITGPPMGHPKSATFRTADIVGLDTLVHTADHCHASLLKDEDRAVFEVPEFVRKMVENKLLGQKSGGGFYRKSRAGIEVIDPQSLEYRAKAGNDAVRGLSKELSRVRDPAERVRRLVADDSVAGRFAWSVLSRSLAYASRRVGEIARDVVAIDRGMRWGFNWELGPFETWDALGFQEVGKRLQAEGHALPASVTDMLSKGQEGFYSENQAKYFDLGAGDYTELKRDPREVTLQVLRRGEAPVLSNGGADAWDIGDGVLCVTFKTKANNVDDGVLEMLHLAAARAERDFQALLIANEGTHFSVGANLMAIAMAASQQQWEPIRKIIEGFQTANQRLKYARVPVVAAPYGIVVGGGLEICLGCDTVQAAAETYAGLVEVGVGLIPAGGGCLNLLWRSLEGTPEGVEVDITKPITGVFKTIGLAKVSSSAQEAQHMGLFRFSDGLSFDRARHLAEAKARAIGLARSGYHPPKPRAYKLWGESGMATLGLMVETMQAAGHATEHDAVISRHLATILSGGAGGAAREVNEDEILALELEHFLQLCGEPKSLERMQHMLTTNKPLRN